MLRACSWPITALGAGDTKVSGADPVPRAHPLDNRVTVHSGFISSATWSKLGTERSKSPPLTATDKGLTHLR